MTLDVGAVRELAETLKIARKADTLNMGTWVSKDWTDKYSQIRPTITEENRPQPQNTCGSSGCAAGWYAYQHAPVGTYFSPEQMYFPDGSRHFIPRWVSIQLGMTADQASYVFYCGDDAIIPVLEYLADHPRASSLALTRVVGAISAT